MSQDKKAYFQGGGSVNEPTPKKKKYKSDPALVVQPRFKEPFYRNYDLYDIPGFEHVGPGAGWHHMDKFKSIKDFLKEKRKKMKDKYKPDDSWQMDDGSRTKKNPGIKARAVIFNRIIKNADHMMPPKEHGTSIYDWKNSPYQGTPKKPKRHDCNDIDFPIDDQIESGPILGDSGSYSDSVPIGGQLDEYLTEPDFEGKSPDQLNFGHDYVEDEHADKELDLDVLFQKYLQPAEPSLYGLPDGISPPEDLDAPNDENPQYGETNSGNTLYDKMSI